MLLSTTCAACGAPGAPVCGRCSAALLPAGPSPPPAGLRACAALVLFEGVGRDLVLGVKYRNRRAAVRLLGVAMAALVDPAALDVVTWAPTSGVRRGRRGYDQGQLLARAVARELGRPCRRLLRRGPGPPQTGRDAVDRRRGPRFVAVGVPSGSRVLVVDDVVTTGATLTAAARALADAGALDVSGLVTARTPLKLGADTADTPGTGPAALLASRHRRRLEGAVVEIIISSRGPEPSEALASATRQKIGRLSRRHDGMDLARVHYSEEKNPRIDAKEVCDVVIEGHGRQVQCKASASDSFTALDLAVEKLEHQLTKLKS